MKYVSGGPLVQGAEPGSTLVPSSSFHPFTQDTQSQGLGRGEPASLCCLAPLLVGGGAGGRREKDNIGCCEKE